MGCCVSAENVPFTFTALPQVFSAHFSMAVYHSNIVCYIHTGIYVKMSLTYCKSGLKYSIYYFHKSLIKWCLMIITTDLQQELELNNLLKNHHAHVSCDVYVLLTTFLQKF